MKFTMGYAANLLTKATLSGAEQLTKGVGWAVSQAISDKTFQEKANQLANNIKKNSEIISNKAESMVDKTIIGVGNATGYVCKETAKAMGASPENVRKAEEIGNSVGKVATGCAVGVAATSVLISSLAASGTAGAASFTSGLATLGGGSAGLGMVVGVLLQLVLLSHLLSLHIIPKSPKTLRKYMKKSLIFWKMNLKIKCCF